MHVRKRHRCTKANCTKSNTALGPIPSQMYECVGKKQKGKFIKENENILSPENGAVKSSSFSKLCLFLEKTEALR